MIEEIKKILNKLGPLGLFVIPFVLIASCLLGILMLFGVIGGNRAINPNDIENPQSAVSSIYLGENNERIEVEIADSPDEWDMGLMFRTNLSENKGMLFVFPNESLRSFWMKNTYVSLDIIFINSEGTILNFFENAEPLNELKTYTSSGGAKYVLELKNGTVERLKIKVGEKVNLSEI